MRTLSITPLSVSMDSIGRSVSRQGTFSASSRYRSLKANPMFRIIRGRIGTYRLKKRQSFFVTRGIGISDIQNSHNTIIHILNHEEMGEGFGSPTAGPRTGINRTEQNRKERLFCSSW